MHCGNISGTKSVTVGPGSLNGDLYSSGHSSIIGCLQFLNRVETPLTTLLHPVSGDSPMDKQLWTNSGCLSIGESPLIFAVHTAAIPQFTTRDALDCHYSYGVFHFVSTFVTKSVKVTGKPTQFIVKKCPVTHKSTPAKLPKNHQTNVLKSSRKRFLNWR